MKILILSNSGMGLYQFRRELIEELMKQKNDVYLSLPNDEAILKFKKIGCNYNEIQVDRRGINPITDLKLIFSYLRLIRQVNPKLVLTYTIKPNIYGGIACELLKVPYIANITGLGTAVENKGIMQKLAIFLYKLTFRKIKVLFFQNTNNRQFFIEHNIAIKKHHLLPGSGVNLKYFQKLDYPPDGIISFVFIGRMMKDKGIDDYLEAANEIKKKYPKTAFHLCGACEEDYEDKLKSLDKVIIYHGIVEDVQEILKKMHCTVLPSYHEGMSNVLLESAACARPVLASRVPGCLETFDEGISGFGFEAKNPSSLCDAIEKFMALSYERKKDMGLAGRKKMETSFDRQIVVEAYLKEIRKVERQ